MDTPVSKMSGEQKRSICNFIFYGCDRKTACHLARCSLDELRRELIADKQFLVDLLRSEAKAKLHHLLNIQKAAEDPKNWRASTWWLERADPRVYGGRPADALTADDLKSFADTIAKTVVDEVAHPAERDRLIARITSLSNEPDGADAAPLHGDCS